MIDAAPLTADERSQMVGGWGHGSLMVLAEGDRLIGKAFGHSFEIVPQGSDKFVIAEGPPLDTITALRGTDGRITALAVGSEAKLERDP